MEVESDQLVIGQTSLKSDWYRIGGELFRPIKERRKEKQQLPVCYRKLSLFINCSRHEH